MAHVEPRPLAEVAFLRPVLESAQRHLGFVPNSLLTMAHVPHVALAFGLLLSTVRGGDLREAWRSIEDGIPPPEPASGLMDPALLQLAAFAVSVGAGCRYCQAHTSHTLEKMTDLPPGKIADLLNYDGSPHYSPRERAVVGLALAAAEVPNAAQERHFTVLREHFSDRQIVQLVGILAVFGFLNRWNDTIATTLEAAPRDFAADALRLLDWSVGKHASQP
jgi:alkylhydroperoxidase family enzyme